MDQLNWLQFISSLPIGLNKKNSSFKCFKAVAEKLDLVNFDSKIIVVGGTNGKSSTVSILESIFLAAGFSIGSYVSPHLIKYNERIRLNGDCVDDKSLFKACSVIRKATYDIVLGQFEFTTLVALLLFKLNKLDVMVLEVGLGGRFDPVNILDIDLSIITTVSLDHTDVLGKTRDKIGLEKAGIMRSFKPVICGDNMSNSVIRYADSINANIFCLNRSFGYDFKDNGWRWNFSHKVLDGLPQANLPPENVALALMAVYLLSGDFKISYDAITVGLRGLSLPGRFQRIEFNGREIIFDVAHNGESAKLLASNLKKLSFYGNTLAVVGILNDKEIKSILKPLIGVVDSWYLGEVNDLRKSSNNVVGQILQNLGVGSFIKCATVKGSLFEAIKQSDEKDRIVVFGSNHTVAEALKQVYNSAGDKS